MIDSRCVFPAAFFGSYKAVRPRVQRILRQVVRQRTWRPLITSPQMLCNNETGWLLLDGPSPLVTGANVHLFVLWRDLPAMIQPLGESEGLNVYKDLLVSAPRDFWFALVMLGGIQHWVQPRWGNRVERQRMAASCLEQVVNYWDTLEMLADRFSLGLPQSTPWPGWAFSVFRLCEEIDSVFDDYKQCEKTTSMETGKKLMAFVAELHNQGTLGGVI
jgi:hypothetical protein